jgi:hypothetical protein
MNPTRRGKKAFARAKRNETKQQTQADRRGTVALRGFSDANHLPRVRPKTSDNTKAKLSLPPKKKLLFMVFGMVEDLNR